MFSEIYTALFTLSIVLINPFGLEGGKVWTYPKVAAVFSIIVMNVVLIIKHRKSVRLILAKDKIGFLLWIAFVACGVVSTLLSPMPHHSIWGHEAMWDGLAYWSGLAVFATTTFIATSLKPQYVRAQAKGLLAGGIILALTMIPQLVDWTIDYTATNGEILDLQREILSSKIWRIQMPIGLYSHRGHAGFVLAACAVLAWWMRTKRWVPTPLAVGAFFLTTALLLFTQTRGPLFGLIAAVLYMTWTSRRDRERWASVLKIALGTSACALLIFFISSKLQLHAPRDVDLVPSIEALTEGKTEKKSSKFNDFTTGRVTLAKTALEGIKERPFFGWGHNGFAIAYPYVTGCFDRARKSGGIVACDVLTTKAHNFIFDIILSIGFVGLAVYLSIFFRYFKRARSNKNFHGIEAIGLAYFIYGLTWFEAAQFTHIAWWALAVGAARARDDKRI